MDSGNLHSTGYEPRQSSLKFSGKKDDWPAFRWQFLSTITSFGDVAMEILDTKYDDLIAKKITEQKQSRLNSKARRTQKTRQLQKRTKLSLHCLIISSR